MQINQHDLTDAVKAKLISSAQAKQLWEFWQTQQENVPQFRLSHVLYYLGGLLAISAVTLFVTQAWEQLRGFPLFVITTLLFLLGALLARYFWQKKLVVPAGIMSTFSLALVPLAVYNIQLWLGLIPAVNYQYSDFHEFVNWYWVPMELVTLLVGMIMLYLLDFPFLLFPIAIALWYLSMDLFSLFFQVYSFEGRAKFSLFFGLIMLVFAVYLDFKYDENKRKDYAFWVYIFGVMAFWGGLSLLNSNSEWSKFFYCLINVAMIFVSVILNRRVFAIFGAIGILGYLGHLAFSLFADSLAFPLVLVFLGILIIFAAMRWQLFEKNLMIKLRPFIPKKLLRRM